MLVSYRPNQDFDADQRREILDTIKAQLAGIGRGNIQVEMYCFDPTIEDIMCNASEIRCLIRSFLDKNALPGREEKVTNLIRTELEKAQVEVAAKIKASGASAEEKARLNAKLEDEVKQFKEKCDCVFFKLNDESQRLCDEVECDIDSAVNDCFNAYYLEVEKCGAIYEMKSVLDRAEVTLKSNLSQRVSGIGIMVQTKLETSLKKYTQDISGIYNDWNQFLSDEFAVKRPFLTKIPNFVWNITNVVVAMLHKKFVIIIVTQLIKEIAEWTAKRSILKSVRSCLDEAKGDVHRRIADMIRTNVENSLAQIKCTIEASNMKQVEAIRAGMGTMAESVAAKAKFEAAKADIESVLAVL